MSGLAPLTDEFKKCLDDWSKSNNQGLVLLSQSFGQDYVDLQEITASLRHVLEAMYAEYDRICEKDIACDREEVRALLSMYDQEFMVKESIQSIVIKKKFFTEQHLAGCVALWKAEPYLEKVEL